MPSSSLLPADFGSVVEVYCPSCHRPQAVRLRSDLGLRTRLVCWLCGHSFYCELFLHWRLVGSPDREAFPAAVVGLSPASVNPPSRRLVYVAHPLAGDVSGNIERVKQICRLIAASYPDVVPVSPILLNSYLREPEDRERALAYCLAVLPHCRELWLTGDWQHSEGCQLELALADRLAMPVSVADLGADGSRLTVSPLVTPSASGATLVAAHQRLRLRLDALRDGTPETDHLLDTASKALDHYVSLVGSEETRESWPEPADPDLLALSEVIRAAGESVSQGS